MGRNPSIRFFHAIFGGSRRTHESLPFVLRDQPVIMTFMALKPEVELVCHSLHRDLAIKWSLQQVRPVGNCDHIDRFSQEF